MGLFYAGPLRRTGLETIPQYLSSHYGPSAEIAGSLISSFGSLFSAVSSTLPGIAVLSALFGLPPRTSCLVLMLSVLAYIWSGGHERSRYIRNDQTEYFVEHSHVCRMECGNSSVQ